MPPVVAAISAFAAAAATEVGIDVAVAVGSGLAGEIAGALTYSAIEVGIYAGISLGIGLLTAPKIPDPAALQTPLKQAMPVRQSAFGRVRVSGAYALFAAGSGGSKTVAHQVLALLDGRSHQVVNYYLNDDLMAENGGGYWYAPGAYGKYGQGDGAGNLVQIDSRIGNTPEVPYAISGSMPLWDSSHRGDGVTSMVVVCKQAHKEDQAACFPNGVPSPSAAFDAQLVYDPRDEAQTQGDPSTYLFSDNPALCLLAYLTDASGGMGLDYARFIAPTIDYWKAVADECDGLVSTSGMHATLSEPSAAGDHFVFLNDTTGLAAGVAITLPTETATVTSLGGGGEVFVTPELTYAHAAGELAYWSTTGQQKLYRCAGTYRHDNAPGDVIKSILSSFDGWLGARGDGALVPRTNTLSTPSVVLTDRHVVGYQVQHYLPDEQAVNQLIVSYTDPAASFNKAEAGYVQDDADIAARGTVRSQQLGLDWVPSAPQALRIARSVLARSTQPLRGTVTCNLAGLAVLGERYVKLQLSELPELNDLTVEVTGKPTIDLAAMTVSFPWIAASAVSSTEPAEGSNPAPEHQNAVTDGAWSVILPVSATAGNALIAMGTSPDGYPTVNTAAGWTEVSRHEGVVSYLGSDEVTYGVLVWKRATAADTNHPAPFAGSATYQDAFCYAEVANCGDLPGALESITWASPPSPAGGENATAVASAAAAAAGDFAISMSGWYGTAATVVLTLSEGAWTNQADDHALLASSALIGSQSVSEAGATITATCNVGHPWYGLLSVLLILRSNTHAVSVPGPPSGGVLDPLNAPTIISVTPDYVDSGGGVAGARLAIEVDDPGLDNLVWKVRWKLSADSVWASAGDNLTAVGSPLTLLTGLVAATGAVDVQVAYATANQTSPWSSTTTVTVSAPVAVVTDAATATEALAAGNVCNLYTASGAAKVQKANATDLTKPANCFVLAAVASSASATVFMPGQYITGLSGLTPGATYYLSTTGGGITTTAPSASGNGVQIVGVADSTGTKLFFDPQPMTGN